MGDGRGLLRQTLAPLAAMVMLASLPPASAGTHPLAAEPVATTDVFLIPWQDTDGPLAERAHRRPDSQPTPKPPPIAPYHSRDFELLWHRYLPDPIDLTTGICAPTEMIFAGNYFNSPVRAEADPLFGDGTPDWVYPGTEWYTDAARMADVLAAIDAAYDDSVCTIREWRSGSSEELWSYVIHPCRPLTGEGWSSGKGIQISDDGSTIAVLVNMYAPVGLSGRLLIFNPGTGTPATVYDLPDGTGSALQITPDGAYIAIYAWPYIYVYDRYADALRWSGSAGAGNDALAISGDGRYLAWGWWDFYLREWNGSSYQPLWHTSQGGTYLITECALSGDENLLALAWYRDSTFDDTVIELYELPSLAQLWTYHYVPTASERPTDVASEIVFSNDNRHFAISSWGGFFPELHVFRSDGPEPVVILDTPGTMFDVDIMSIGWAGSYVTACGKHVHAGMGGRGGDLYALWIPEGSGVDADDAHDLVPRAGALQLQCSPNPVTALGSGATKQNIHFRLDTTTSVRLDLYSALGTHVRTLADGLLPAGDHRVSWDGHGEARAYLPSGTYFLRLRTPETCAESRILMIR